MAERRELRFDSLAAVTAEADRLRRDGYDRAGNWDLAQVCGHLADWMSFPLDGFPIPPWPIRVMLWGLRKTVGRKKFLEYTGQGWMPVGKPTMPQTVHAAGDTDAAVGRLRLAAERFQAYTGPINPSPLFGEMTKDEAVKLQLVHCAHHLSFLVPKKS